MRTRTFIGSVDVRQAVRPLWGTFGYSGARILLRAGRHPLQETWLPLDPSAPAIPPEALAQQVAELGAFQAFSMTEVPVPWPAISVIVCTRNRAAPLARCLGRLRLMRYPDFEIVVVDNASTTVETRQVAERLHCRYVREDRPGLDWARNRGFAEARHALVAYIDDDALADPYWLEGIARGFRDPDIACVTGLTLPAELETAPQHVFERYGGMGKGFAPRRFSAASMSPRRVLRAQNVGVGTNMAYRRTVLVELGGFDTALDVGTPSGGGGDLDMFYRVLAAGRDVMYEPSALVRHQHRRDWAGLERQIRNNGQSFGVYLIKRFREGTTPPREVLRFALTDWGRWLLGRPLKKLFLRRGVVPLRLMLAEVAGALAAPGAYRRTYAHDRQLRERQRPD